MQTVSPVSLQKENSVSYSKLTYVLLRTRYGEALHTQIIVFITLGVARRRSNLDGCPGIPKSLGSVLSVFCHLYGQGYWAVNCKTIISKDI